MTTPEDVLTYWLDEIGPEGWYAGGDELDAEIRAKFEAAWNEMMDGAYSLWLTYPSGALAYLILADQFPRNMFRDTEAAFASDHVARTVAKSAIGKGWDLKIDLPARQFFYMPLMHSEALTDQDRCVRLIKERMDDDTPHLLHAKAHREVIRCHGRFPTRNAALGRNNKPAEHTYLAEGGYGAVVRTLEAQIV